MKLAPLRQNQMRADDRNGSKEPCLRRSGKAGGGIPLACFMIVVNQLFSLAKNKLVKGLRLPLRAMASAAARHRSNETAKFGVLASVSFQKLVGFFLTGFASFDNVTLREEDFL